MEETERTPHGDEIHRHITSKHGELAPVKGKSHLEQISEHVERWVGPIESALHEIVSHLVHIDVLCVLPSKKMPYYVFGTSGMSDLPMQAPEGLEDYRYAELCILLSPDWPIDFGGNKATDQIFPGENAYWPIRWLKQLALFPHEYDTWLGWGHTIPNGKEAAPFADNTKFGCFILLPPFELPYDFFELLIDDGKIIRFYCLNALYKEEMEYKFEEGVEKLLEKFDQYHISSVITVDRVNVG